MAARITRRTTLAGAAVAGVPLLAACGGGDDAPTTADPTTPAGTPESPTPSTPAASDPTPSDRPEPPPDAFARTRDVPVGGGTVFADEAVVVTQPREGVFRGFSAECTHRGCIVAEVASGTIDCGCHGSRFSIDDGSVATGPATEPLPPVDLVVRAGGIARA